MNKTQCEKILNESYNRGANGTDYEGYINEIRDHYYDICNKQTEQDLLRMEREWQGLDEYCPF